MSEPANAKITAVLDSKETQSFTTTDWIELAVAALDQAGVPVGEQARVRALLPEATAAAERRASFDAEFQATKQAHGVLVKYLRRVGEEGATRNMLLMRLEDALPDGEELDEPTALAALDKLVSYKRAWEHEGRFYAVGTATLRSLVSRVLDAYSRELAAALPRAAAGDEQAWRVVYDLKWSKLPKATRPIAGDLSAPAKAIRARVRGLLDAAREGLAAHGDARAAQWEAAQEAAEEEAA